MLTPPLKRMKQTQPFGVDWTGENLYAKLGLKGHNGWDLSAPTGTEVFAVMDGIVYNDTEPASQVGSFGGGYGINARIRSRDLGLEVVYAHLERPMKEHGTIIKAGELIAISDNTGLSNGPHLHLGIRKIAWAPSGSGPFVLNSGNGFLGYLDPAPFFAPDIFDLPVDKQYGLTNQTPGVPSEIEWMKTNVWFFKNLKRLMTTRERNAFRYGFWDLRTVLDPAMFTVWSEMTKPEAKKRGLIK